MTLVDDFALVHAAARDAVSLAARRNAARRIADWLWRYLTRVVDVRLVPLRNAGFAVTTAIDKTCGTVTISTGPGADHSAFDWERLRVNVAHCVSPAIVTWRAA